MAQQLIQLAARRDAGAAVLAARQQQFAQLQQDVLDHMHADSTGSVDCTRVLTDRHDVASASASTLCVPSTYAVATFIVDTRTCCWHEADRLLMSSSQSGGPARPRVLNMTGHMLTPAAGVCADAGSDINAALDQRPLSERAMQFLAVTAAGLLSLAAWQTQTLQVSAWCSSLQLLAVHYAVLSGKCSHEPSQAGGQLNCAGMHLDACRCAACMPASES